MAWIMVIPRVMRGGFAGAADDSTADAVDLDAQLAPADVPGQQEHAADVGMACADALFDGRCLGAVAHVHLEQRVSRFLSGTELAGGVQQLVEIDQRLVDLGQRVAGMLGGVPDHGGGAGHEQLAGTGQRRAGEGRRGRSVLARIAPGADLARVLDGDAADTRGETVDLQHASTVTATDRGSGRKAVARAFAETARPPAAEVAVAFLVTGAVIDRVEVVPQAQHFGTRLAVEAAAIDQRGDLAVGAFGRGIKATGVAFIDVDGEEQVVAVAAPADRAVDAVADHTRAAPHFDQRFMQGIQTDREAAGIVAADGGAEADHREHVGLAEQRVRRRARVAQPQARQRLGARV